MRTVFLVIVICVLVKSTFATHLKAGYISYRQVSGNKFEISVTVYTDKGSEVRFGEGFLDFGDGSEPFLLPIIENNVHAVLGEDGVVIVEPIEPTNRLDAGISRFTLIHDFKHEGLTRIAYTEPNRNEGILNIENSVNTTFSLYTAFTLETSYQTTISPTLLFDPIIYANLGIDFSQSIAAIDSNDFKIRYELVTPRANKLDEVAGYFLPDGVELNKLNGLLEWPAQDQTSNLGEYVFAVAIKQYQRVEGDDFIEKGRMIVDFQVLLSEVDGNISIDRDEKLNDDNALLVTEDDSQVVSFIVDASDQEVVFSVKSELVSFGSDIFDYSVTETEVGYQIDLTFNAHENVQRENPYNVAVSALVPFNKIEAHFNVLSYTQSIDDILNEVSFITSTEFNNYTDVEFFPNPSLDYLKSNNFVNNQIQILNNRGQIISEFYSVQDIIDLVDFKPGLYFIRVDNSSPIRVIKK